MPRLYLPTHQYSRPYPFPKDEREELLNRLHETRTLLPGARTMPLEELRDYVHAQEGKEREGHYEKKYPSKHPAPMTPKQYDEARGALREYAEWRRRRNGGG
jgi:hypothetical protein